MAQVTLWTIKVFPAGTAENVTTHVVVDDGQVAVSLWI